MIRVVGNWLIFLTAPLWVWPVGVVSILSSLFWDGDAGFAMRQFVRGEKWWWE